MLGAGGRLGRLLRPVFPSPARWFARTEVDVCDLSALRAALRGADTVLCMAGVTNTSAQPMHMNADLSLRTLEAARDVGAGHVFLFSSASVYGANAGICTENGPVSPASEYAESKLAMERVAREHAHPNTVLRLGNVAGADAILSGWRAGFQLDQLPDGGTPQRSYIGPHALTQTLVDLALASGLPPVLNVAAPGCVPMGALLDAAELNWTPRPATAATIPSVYLDTTQLCTFTDFKASDSTPEGIVKDWQSRAE